MLGNVAPGPASGNSVGVYGLVAIPERRRPRSGRIYVSNERKDRLYVVNPAAGRAPIASPATEWDAIGVTADFRYRRVSVVNRMGRLEEEAGQRCRDA